MNSRVILLANKEGEIKRFLEMFENKKLDSENSLYWQKEFPNPVEMAEIIAAFVDNINNFNLIMWITLDKNIYIRVSSINSNYIIKYLFERFPY